MDVVSLPLFLNQLQEGAEPLSFTIVEQVLNVLFVVGVEIVPGEGVLSDNSIDMLQAGSISGIEICNETLWQLFVGYPCREDEIEAGMGFPCSREVVVVFEVIELL
jgi:hypothetical protein